MIHQRTLVFGWVGFLSMCNAACANGCFYVPATCRPTRAKRQNIRNKEAFVI